MPFGLSLSKPSRGRRLLRWARVLWAAPNTLIGLAFGLSLLLAFGARWRRVGGVIEIAALHHAPRRRWPFAAITLGHVIVGTHAAELERLRAHERVHVRQCERWGPLFLPAYALAGLWQWLCGRRAYRDNPFEVEARRTGGC
ncbi:signal peptide prediction [Hydrogenophaga sp.]|uniref:signal peptide prediction n=1 Tax=Hydrogenophaga sp. TaxID=1904254 RepID=UPI00286E62D1|nr:signal peptide prediction [Hydrogenophaga sp.]